MQLREFLRFHLLKVLLAFVAIQIIIIGIIEINNQRPKAERNYTNMTEGKSIKIAPLSNIAIHDDKQAL
jgi:uncharacterized membrane protein